MKPEVMERLRKASAADLYTERIEVEGFGPVIVKAVTARDAIDFRAHLKELQDRDDPNVDVLVMAHAVARTVHDESGERLFGDDDVDAVVEAIPLPLLVKLGQAALTISGMAAAPAAEHMGKSSPASPSSEPPTP